MKTRRKFIVDSGRCSLPNFSLTLIQCPGTTNNSCGGVTAALIFHCLEICGGGPFCELQTAFFYCKLGSKTCQFGKPISISNSDPKVIDVFFFEGVRLYFLLFVPLFFLFLGCLFGLPSVINCRNPYIEYG